MKTIVKKITKVIKKPSIIGIILLSTKISRSLSDEAFLKIKYRLRFNRNLNLASPLSFNEKMQWLKIHDRKLIYNKLVDKYAVREFIIKAFGEEYLIPLLGIYSSYDEIDFETLPNQFVLKPNHTSGDVFICEDKSKLDMKLLKREIDKWMHREYFWLHREWPYKDIKPKIICEKFMIDIESSDLKDYKFMCFNGEPKIVLLCQNRKQENGPDLDFYDMDWNILDLKRVKHNRSGYVSSRPLHFEKMIDISKKIAKDMPFVRIDFYEVNGRIYFGEVTFYPGAGFEEFSPEKYDEMLGSWIDLSLINKEGSGV